MRVTLSISTLKINESYGVEFSISLYFVEVNTEVTSIIENKHCLINVNQIINLTTVPTEN